MWVLGPSPDPATEESPLNPTPIASWRPAHEKLVLDAVSPTLRTMVVRPGVVYGNGGGMVGDLLKMASNGLVRVVGDGNNHWPLVYDRDLADLYARLVANPEASGIYHANDEGDERLNDIIAAIKPHVAHRPDVRYVPIDEARTKMGPMADAWALDQVVRSARARALGWAPVAPIRSGQRGASARGVAHANANEQVPGVPGVPAVPEVASVSPRFGSPSRSAGL